MKNPTRSAALCAGLALLSLGAVAGRPLATEDADVLDAGSCEWESFAARTTASGQPPANGWATQVGCGFGSTWQVALAYSHSQSDGNGTHGLTLGGKTRLIARQDESTGLTLAWALSALKTSDQSLRQEGTLLSLVATRALGAGFTGHANLGWSHSRSASASSTTWNLALERAFHSGLDVMGEVYGDDRTRPWLGLGARYAASDRLSLNASWAVQNESTRVRLFSLGFKLGF